MVIIGISFFAEGTAGGPAYCLEMFLPDHGSCLAAGGTGKSLSDIHKV